jgi:hypothetical protein
MFARSTPLGVTSLHAPRAGADAGSAATVTDGKFGRTLRATARVLTILYIVNPTTEWDRGLRMGAEPGCTSCSAKGSSPTYPRPPDAHVAWL